MTAVPTSVVTVERDGNVTFLHWHPVEPPRPPLLPKLPAVGGGSACRRAYLARCWRRSQLRRDLADAGALIGFAVAALLCVVIWPNEITHLAYTLLGGGQ